MTDSPPDAKSKTRATTEQTNPQRPGVKTEHGFNFGVLAVYHVLVRTGWIFKTESIIMPAVLDLIGGQGWLRGCLPMLNRFGQSIPPLLASDKLRNTAIKKYALATCSCLMGACFLALSLVWMITDGKPSWWLPIVFLLIYGVFFASTGINQLIYSTMTGKLIATRKRGRLMLVSTTIGATIAIFFAWFLLNRWLGEESGNFTKIFAFTGFAFLSAGGLTLLLKEQEDIPTGTKRTGMDLFKMSFATLVNDKNFRRLAIVASLFGMSMTLFPHYQSLGRGRLMLGLTALIPWVIAQNAGAAVFSIPTGWAGSVWISFGTSSFDAGIMRGSCSRADFGAIGSGGAAVFHWCILSGWFDTSDHARVQQLHAGNCGAQIPSAILVDAESVHGGTGNIDVQFFGVDDRLV